MLLGYDLTADAVDMLGKGEGCSIAAGIVIDSEKGGKKACAWSFRWATTGESYMKENIRTSMVDKHCKPMQPLTNTSYTLTLKRAKNIRGIAAGSIEVHYSWLKLCGLEIILKIISQIKIVTYS